MERRGYNRALSKLEPIGKWIMPPEANPLQKLAILGSDVTAITGAITTAWYADQPLLAVIPGIIAVHSAGGSVLFRMIARYNPNL